DRDERARERDAQGGFRIPLHGLLEPWASSRDVDLAQLPPVATEHAGPGDGELGDDGPAVARVARVEELRREVGDRLVDGVELGLAGDALNDGLADGGTQFDRVVLEVFDEETRLHDVVERGADDLVAPPDLQEGAAR